jgi:hypothetical protein
MFDIILAIHDSPKILKSFKEAPGEVHNEKSLQKTRKASQTKTSGRNIKQDLYKLKKIR